MSKRNENSQQHEQKNPTGATQEIPAPAQGSQTQNAQSQGSPDPPDELNRYRSLAEGLRNSVAELELLHETRSGFVLRAEQLDAERTELQSKLLDGDGADTVRLLVLNGDTEALNEHRLAAVTARTRQAEQALQSRLPAASLAFARLLAYLLGAALERATGRIAALLTPAARQLTEVSAIALHELDYARLATLTVPAASWATQNSLTEQPVPFGAMARPYTQKELTEHRKRIVDGILSTAGQLVEVGRKIISECAPFSENVPLFDQPEVEPPAPSGVPLEWNTALFSTDDDFVRETCRIAGKNPDALSPQEQAIVAAMLEERRKMPVASAIFSGEMIGSTTDGRSWKEP